MYEELEDSIISILNSLDFIEEYEYYDVTPEILKGHLTDEYSDLDENEVKKINSAIDFLNSHNITIDHVKQHGGTDMGSLYWVVWKVGDMYFKNTNWYASHYGIDEWNGTKRVYPIEVVKIEYSEEKE